MLPLWRILHELGAQRAYPHLVGYGYRRPATDEREAPMSQGLFATLYTTAGPIRLELFPNHAPKTVRNFVELTEGGRDYTDPRTGRPGSGPYYDGTIFHRV